MCSAPCGWWPSECAVLPADGGLSECAVLPAGGGLSECAVLPAGGGGAATLWDVITHSKASSSRLTPNLPTVHLL